MLLMSCVVLGVGESYCLCIESNMVEVLCYVVEFMGVDFGNGFLVGC